jgi:transposase InsO family protein
MYFKKIKAAAELELGCKLKAFRTDCGGEFNSGMFVTFCREQGIKHNTTTPYMPQQNGVVERCNQSVVQMVRCLLKSMSVPGKFWGEGVQTEVGLLLRA